MGLCWKFHFIVSAMMYVKREVKAYKADRDINLQHGYTPLFD
jgi:hypothetical protein